MIKMDVEGFEESVIKGARQSLASDAVKAVELETVTPAIEATLEQCKFKRAFYNPFHRALTAAPGNLAASNALFVKDWDFIAARLTSAPAVEVFGKSI